MAGLGATAHGSVDVDCDWGLPLGVGPVLMGEGLTVELLIRLIAGTGKASTLPTCRTLTLHMPRDST